MIDNVVEGELCQAEYAMENHPLTTCTKEKLPLILEHTFMSSVVVSGQERRVFRKSCNSTLRSTSGPVSPEGF